MNKNISILVAVFLLLTTGCATTSKLNAFPEMYNEKPAAIMVIPSINKSTAADAPILYSSTINEPLSNAGFYVLPIEITDRFLINEGLSQGEMLIDIPPQKFSDSFGADAVLYVTIDKWDTNYFLIGGNVTVAARFLLKSTKTGDTLWAYKGEMVMDTSGNDNGGGLLAKLISAAITTAAQDYVPIARNVNLMALQAIPYGKYHKMYGKDQSMMVNVEK